MTTINQQALAIVEDLALSRQQVAQYLNVTTESVDNWFAQEDSPSHEVMPESELNFLKYCLMTDNKRSHLF